MKRADVRGGGWSGGAPLRQIASIAAASPIMFEPGTREEEYFDIINNKVSVDRQFKVHAAASTGTIDLRGGYGGGLMNEVSSYAYIAEEIAKQFQFDVIHAHDWMTYDAGIAAKRVSGKPLVVHVHATEFDRSGMHVNQVVYDMERRGMHCADKVLTLICVRTSLERFSVSR